MNMVKFSIFTSLILLPVFGFMIAHSIVKADPDSDYLRFSSRDSVTDVISEAQSDQLSVYVEPG